MISSRPYHLGLFLALLIAPNLWAQNHLERMDVKLFFRVCDINSIDFRQRSLDMTPKGSTQFETYTYTYGELELKDILSGDYTIRYTNLFDQIMTYSITIDTSNLEHIICTDDYNDDGEENIFDFITSSDTLSIEFKSMGCFHNVGERLSLYVEEGHWLIDYINDKKVRRTRKASPEDVARVQRFVQQTKYITQVEGGCTTVDQINLKVNQETCLSAVDRGCRWRGFKGLIYHFFQKDTPEDSLQK